MAAKILDDPSVARDYLMQGGIIAYPTESVFGLGCDPDNEDALDRLLQIKNRPSNKGMLIVCHDFDLAKSYLDLSRVTQDELSYAFSKWPGFYTFVMPAKKQVSCKLVGDHSSIAVRVSSHPVIASLCASFGKPLVSTSANLSGQTPCRSCQQVTEVFSDKIDAIVLGEVSGEAKPSTIIDLRTRAILRS